MANSSMIFVAIAAVIVIALVAAVLLSLHGPANKTTSTASASNNSSGQGSGTGTNSSSSGSTAGVSGKAGVIGYYATGASGPNGVPALYGPKGNATVECLQGIWNSSSSSSGISGPNNLGGVYTPQCDGAPNVGNSSSVLLAVYNATNYTTANVSFPFSYPYAFNYTVSGYSSSLTVVSIACAQGACSLNLPHGCSTLESKEYGDTGAVVGICANQAPGTYSGSATMTNQSSSDINIAVNVFYS